MKKTYVLLLGVLFTLSSCKEDITASWLKIDTINLVTNATIEGENSNNITDAWVYMDNQVLGVWELPCEIPILAEGNHEFIVYAGIKANGINDTRIKYPFYQSSTFTLNLKKGETVSYTPTVEYKKNITFTGREDFEDIGIILAQDDVSDTTKIYSLPQLTNPTIVKYGNACGRIKINSIDTICQVYTDANLFLPKGQTFLEIDYMNSNTFAIGIISLSSTQGLTVNPPFFRVNAQDKNNMKWKKIYIELTEIISAVDHPISFEYYIVGALDDNNSEGLIYLDNIKIVHYN